MRINALRGPFDRIHDGAGGEMRPSLLAVFSLLALSAFAAHAQDAQPRLWTHESYIEDVTRADTLDVSDPMKVFAFVLNSLPGEVKVYPTENYYYFRFIHRGTPYSGNIRIEVSDKAPTLHFAYYQTETAWHPNENAKTVTLGAAEGVTLEKKGPLSYRVAYHDKSVLFALNDLSHVKPPASALAPDERFIGPIFDESGVQFFLVFNNRLKTFLYVLDETVKPTEEFFPRDEKSRILLGKRTGFAFFRDQKLDRKLLIGAYEDNLLLNTYFDGPFDQLPDNFIEGETLRSAILAATPQLKGKIDRYGRALDRNIRYAIKPYAAYLDPSDLDPIETCARKNEKSANYYACFDATKQQQAEKKTGRR
jgi:hypothetical protein